MKRFWFKKNSKLSKQKKYFLKIDFLFFSLLFFCYLCFNILNFYSKIAFADNKLESIQNNLSNIWILFYPIDKTLTTSFIWLDKIIDNYKKGENILSWDYSDIIYLINVYQNKVEDLIKYWFWDYKEFLLFLNDLFDYKNDLFDLLGKDTPQKYLVLFQNNSEKRPNWWFFGSFAVVTFDKWKLDYKILDSYYPDYINPNWAIQTPNWAKNIFLDQRIWFIAWNKFWFSDMDWKNLIKIYENTFPWEKIKWVIFLNSNFFENILPWFIEKMREWQFVNASIDLIRWENLPFKKELYFKDMQDYIKNNQNTLIQNSLKNFDKLIDNNNLKIYLTWISSWFNSFLENKWLITYYNENKLFFWDYNNGYNKIDRFVSKLIEIYDTNWNLIISSNNDIVSIDKLNKWIYNIKISYSINIPKNYINFINNLEKKYSIKLTEREIHILWLNNLWDTRWLIYFPKNIEIINSSWNTYESNLFYTPFSQNLYYKIKSTSNNSIKNVDIKIQIK